MEISVEIKGNSTNYSTTVYIENNIIVQNNEPIKLSDKKFNEIELKIFCITETNMLYLTGNTIRNIINKKIKEKGLNKAMEIIEETIREVRDEYLKIIDGIKPINIKCTGKIKEDGILLEWNKNEPRQSI